MLKTGRRGVAPTRGGTSRLPNRLKLALSLAVLTLLSTVATAGTYALYATSTPTAPNSFSSGSLSLANDHTATSVLSINQALIPGDSVTGLINVTNTGTEDLSGYKVAVGLSGGAVVNSLTDAARPFSLKLWISRCSVGWTGSGAAATCVAGVQNDVVGTAAAPVNVIGTDSLTIAGSNAFCSNSATQSAAVRLARGVTCDSSLDSAGAADHLKVQIQFPTGADNSYSGLNTVLAFTFSGTQASGASF